MTPVQLVDAATRMTPVILRLVCGWCGRLMQEGTPNAPTSHGLCPLCRTRFERGEAA